MCDRPPVAEPLKASAALWPVMTDESTASDAMAADAMAALKQDAVLEPYVLEHGPVALVPADDIYQRLVVSLISQQVSTDAAASIRERLFQQFEVTPNAMLEADPEKLANVGLSAAKTEYVKETAAAFHDHEYSREYFVDMNNEAVIEELTTIRGVGPWTAKMFLMFALGRQDVFPVEDLGVRRGMELVFDGEMARGDMIDRASKWQPYRSYASLYLWRAYEG